MLRPKESYVPPNRTVVTELKHYVVDQRRNLAAGKFSVAAPVRDKTFTQMDVIVDTDKPYELKDVTNILSVSGSHEFYLEFTGFGAIPEPEIRAEQTFFDAVITAPDFVAGKFLTIHIEDKDIFSNSISVDVMNLRTNETETCVLSSVGRGEFSGILQTRFSTMNGQSFDGFMNCLPSDELEIYYNEPRSAGGKPQHRTAGVFATTPPSTDTRIIVASTVPEGKFLNFQIVNSLGNTVAVKNTRTGYQIITPTVIPISLSEEDSINSMAVVEGDILEISTAGQVDGEPATVKAALAVGNDPHPTVNVASEIVYGEELFIAVKDNNMGDVIVFVNSVPHVGIATYLGSGQYEVKVTVDHNVALAGQTVTLVYKNITKNVLVLPNEADACEKVEPDTGYTKPLTFKVNGHFFLNGSFAGSIKMWADVETRLTLIKS